MEDGDGGVKCLNGWFARNLKGTKKLQVFVKWKDKALARGNELENLCVFDLRGKVLYL